METFNPGWTFSLAYKVEISARLDSKLLFKMTLQLHVKKLARCAELKFQLGVPHWKKMQLYEKSWNQQKSQQKAEICNSSTS